MTLTRSPREGRWLGHSDVETRRGDEEVTGDDRPYENTKRETDGRLLATLRKRIHRQPGVLHPMRDVRVHEQVKDAGRCAVEPRGRPRAADPPPPGPPRAGTEPGQPFGQGEGRTCRTCAITRVVHAPSSSSTDAAMPRPRTGPANRTRMLGPDSDNGDRRTATPNPRMQTPNRGSGSDGRSPRARHQTHAPRRSRMRARPSSEHASVRPGRDIPRQTLA